MLARRFLNLLAKAVYLLVQAALLPRLFKKNYRSFFLAVVDSSDAPTRAIPAPVLRLVTLRLVLAQIVLALIASIFIPSDNPESLRQRTALLRLAEVLLTGPAVIYLSLQAKHANSAIFAFPQPR